MNTEAITKELFWRFQKTGGKLERIDLSGLPLSTVPGGPPQAQATGIEYIDHGVPFNIVRVGFTPSGEVLDLVKVRGPFQLHVHKKLTAQVRIFDGAGWIFVNHRTFRYRQRDRFVAKAGIGHGFGTRTNGKATVFLSIQDRPIKDLGSGEVDFFECTNFRLPVWARARWNGQSLPRKAKRKILYLKPIDMPKPRWRLLFVDYRDKRPQAFKI